MGQGSSEKGVWGLIVNRSSSNIFVLSAAEVVEHACSVTSLILGETMPSITKDMDTYTYRLPLGVCAGIAPFNFPAMIPLWMFPMAMVCGNTFLMKPSERVPGALMFLAKLFQDAGAPDGTLNIIHGQHEGNNNPSWEMTNVCVVVCAQWEVPAGVSETAAWTGFGQMLQLY